MTRPNWTRSELEKRRSDLYEDLDDPHVKDWVDKVREIEEIDQELLILEDDTIPY